MKVIASVFCFLVILFFALQLGWLALFIVPLAALFVALSFAPYWTANNNLQSQIQTAYSVPSSESGD